MSETLARIQDEAVAYFLCEYSPTSPVGKLVDIAREVVGRRYATQTVEEFIENRLDFLREALVVEYNERVEYDRPLRYEIVDAACVGELLRGRRNLASKQRIEFQDALNKLAPSQFECLAAVVLERFDCEEVFRTPQSHDQGVDAFGYRHVVPALSRAVTHKFVWIAQAKHYVHSAVSTNVVRELVGTGELLVSRVFSTVDERYKDLELKPWAPSAVLLLTTHEVPSTVRRTASRAGVFVMESSDLFDVFRADFPEGCTVEALSEFVKANSDKYTLLS